MPASSAASTGYQLNGLIERVTFFSEELTQGIDVFVPDSNLACELNGGPAAEHTDGCVHRRSDLVQSMRAKLRSVAGQTIYRKRKALVEPVFGTLKAQREGRRFRLRGLAKVRLEFCFMALAYNLTRLHKLSGPLQIT
jgi:Transposase DDE domain